jgi:two-component system copper resistance phosphate regulon response regulator CusR
MRILVIEDNERLAGLVQQGLEEQGYQVDTSHSGRAGEELAAKDQYDVIILDVMLPDHDGVQVCRELRRRGLSTPILMLTALAATEEKVSGLDAGADDYLTKPFDFEELVARVRALMRRSQANEGASLRFGGIEMDLVGAQGGARRQSGGTDREGVCAAGVLHAQSGACADAHEHRRTRVGPAV